MPSHPPRPRLTFAERSSQMLETLAALERDYRTTMDSNVSLEEAGDLLIGAARIMSEDVAAWQDLYGRKRLTLPA
jgi:hypothetical protein